MPTQYRYRAPDLYFEKPTDRVLGAHPLEAARIDTAAFFGFARRGPVSTPVRVTTWKSFEAIFGGFAGEYYLPQAVFSFFANGGDEAVIVRIAVEEGEGAAQTARATLKDLYGRPTLRATARDPGAWGDRVKLRVLAGSRPPRTGLVTALEPGATEAKVQLTRGFEPGAVVRVQQGTKTEYVRLTGVERKKLVWDGREALRGSYERGLARIEGVELQVHVTSPFGFEIHDNLVFTPGHPRDLVAVVNERSSIVELEDLGSRTPPPYDLPQAEVEEALAGGRDGTRAVRPEHFIGFDAGPAKRRGLFCLEEMDDVGLICLPDLQAGLERGAFGDDGDIEVVQQAVVDFCERRKVHFALLDVPRRFDVDQALDWRARFDSKYAALYWPWYVVQDPASRGATRVVPPCGHIAGLTSKTDREVGVHRVAANLPLNGVIGLERELNKDLLDWLAPEGVNCSRNFRGRGIRPWGARTLASDRQWVHLNVRRLFIMIERTIAEGCEWAVFEPNTPRTWKAVERQVSAFLYKLWKEGMLQGEVPEQAFYVRCDESLNPPEVRDAGEFHCEVGLAAVRPAEFIVFRIGQMAKDIITEEPVS